jgi:DNA-binding MarR family transcriptional regulator
MPVTPGQCAQGVLDVVPAVMRFIRSQMRGHRGAGLSVPQLRALLFVHRNEGASLGGLAEHLGLTPPSASKLVEELVGRGLLRRRPSSADRRRISLGISPEGSRILEAALEQTHRQLSRALAALAPSDLRTVSRAMEALRNAFAAPARAQP